MPEISGTAGERIERENLVAEARKFQRDILLRTYTENGSIEPTCFRASAIIDALIDRIEQP